jgi:ABC-type oligopeptide transport system ATPase subunit
MMFISHDLSVVRYIADRIAVMRHGKLVEMESTADIFKTPSQEYTKQLIAAVPLADPTKEKERQVIAGNKLKLMTRESI